MEVIEVRRGGSWIHEGIYSRSASRGQRIPSFSNSAFGFRLAFKQITEPPTDLNSTAELTIAENQPIGTIVGEFNATDPDGDAITYHLVSGGGDANTSPFTLDQNGTLKTAAVFEYASGGSSLSIRVQGKG